MTSQDRPDEFADRVSALEHQQRADRRALGSLDADVSDLQAQRRADVRLLESLRLTQRGHGEQLQRIGRDVSDLSDGLAAARQTQQEHGEQLQHVRRDADDGFAAVRSQLDGIVRLLQRGVK
ncbi:MAG TPA: hypothetical protein VMT69_04070 [Kineosporiaceae bacterium]|nr:hypothetical protein [Kineosporiaceae bacterium]